MTTEERNKKIEEGSGMQVLAEIGRLLLLLMGKLLLRFLKIIIKGVKLVIRLVRKGGEAAILFWKSTSTQVKLRRLRMLLKKGTKVFGRWCLVGLKYTIRFVIYCIKAVVQGVIHLRPTLIKIGKGLRRACAATGRWLVRCGRGMRLWRIRRGRAYKRFRRNKGVKGLMIDVKNGLKSAINQYMEEEQADVDPDAVTEDEIIEEEMESDNKAQIIGKKLFTSVKNIVEVNEDETESV